VPDRHVDEVHQLHHITWPKTDSRRFRLEVLPVMTAIVTAVIVPVTFVIADRAE
jgi:hypothetical protein